MKIYFDKHISKNILIPIGAFALFFILFELLSDSKDRPSYLYDLTSIITFVLINAAMCLILLIVFGAIRFSENRGDNERR
jgi:small-conductance mechanosensitive channel